jgi:hypothetical protein
MTATVFSCSRTVCGEGDSAGEAVAQASSAATSVAQDRHFPVVMAFSARGALRAAPC